MVKSSNDMMYMMMGSAMAEAVAQDKIEEYAAHLRMSHHNIEVLVKEVAKLTVQRDQLAESLRLHQESLKKWEAALAERDQIIANLERTIDRERQDFQAQLKHERFQQVLDGAVIAGKTAQVKAAGAEMRACPEPHEMLEIGEDGIQKGLKIFREAFDQDLRDQGVENPEQYRAN